MLIKLYSISGDYPGEGDGSAYTGERPYSYFPAATNTK